MSTSRFDLKVSGPLDEELGRMAREQGITKAEAIERALVGYASLRRLVPGDRELLVRPRGQRAHEQRITVL